MQLGSLTLRTISGGTYWIDGGTMFGVVPRPLWERNFPTDEQHRIPQDTNCLLVQTGDRNILIDTGAGSKLTDKERGRLSAQSGDPLVENLASAGLAVEDIDQVVLTHLHFDHAGGATRFDDEGQLVPTFSNAEYVVQREEWVTATAGYPELRAAYSLDNLLPLQDSGQLTLIDSNRDVGSGMRVFVTGGHTQGHQVIILESDDQTAVYLADICPTWRHLPVLWCLSYDTHLLQTRRVKAELLGQIADSGWLALFDHDPDVVAARLERDSRKDFVVSESLESL
jgi:glyoxylase-like metal-dependent hydrolase (beta-lactamase superfamily II)